MKKRLITIVCLLSSLASAAQKDYDITFWIKEFEDSTIYIKGAFGKNIIILDTIRQSNDQSFHWIAENQVPRLLTVSSSQEDMFSFVLDTATKFSIGIEPSGFFWVEGCEANEHYLKYQEENRRIRFAEFEYEQAIENKETDNTDSLKAIYNAFLLHWQRFSEEFYVKYPDNLMTLMVKNLKIPDTPDSFLVAGRLKSGKEMEYAVWFRKHYWDDFAFSDSRILYTPYFFQRFDAYLTKITMQNSDSIFISLKEFCEIAISKGGNPYASYVLNYYLDHYSRMPFSFNERTFILLVDFVLKTAKYYDISPSALDYYKDLANKVKPFLPGNKFPNISLADFSGKKHSLYDQKHQFTIIYFWSAGCESCKKDLEILENLYKTKKNDYDFEVFSIDLDQNLETSASYHIDHPFEWLVLKADSEHIKQRYGLDISLTPELYILDSQKRILNKTVLYSQIEESIKAFLPKK